MSILAIANVSKLLPGGKKLFSNVSATIEIPGSIALIAPSGQGKSTLLRMLALLEAPSGGSIAMEGISHIDWDPIAWRRKVAYAAQLPVMLPGTVEHNLMTASVLHRETFNRDRAEWLMDAVGLSGMSWAKRASELSGGEKQRVALVRTLLGMPSVMLLDEVTASLDQVSKQRVESLLLKLHYEEQLTLIWVTHDLEQAQRVSTRVWQLGEGTLLADVSTKLFFEQQSADLISPSSDTEVNSRECP